MYIFKNSIKALQGPKQFEIKPVFINRPCRSTGDKSISQRALIIGLASIGQTTIKGILDSEDVFHTLKAVGALRAKIIINKSEKTLTINGVGLGNLMSPKNLFLWEIVELELDC